MDQSTPTPPSAKPAWYRRKSTVIVGVIGSLAIVGGVKNANDKKAKEQRAAIVAAENRRTDSIEKAMRTAADKAKADSIAQLTPEEIAAGERQRKADSVQKAREFARVNDSTTKAVAAAKRATDRARATALANERAAQRRSSSSYQEETYNGHTVYTGPRGGRYYINKNGNKTYIH